MAMWHETGHRAQVTCIVRSPQKDNFAVGYADGSIRLWNAPTESVLTTFNGHKKAVTALAFDEQGARLASGSQDTDLIVWDVVAEAGLYRYVSISLHCAFSPHPHVLKKDFEGTETKLPQSVSWLPQIPCPQRPQGIMQAWL